MSLTITPLHPLFAAQITGADLSQPIDDGVRRAIERAMDEHAVCVLPSQTLDDDHQIAFARLYGPLEVSPPVQTKSGSIVFNTRVRHREIFDVSNLDDWTEDIEPSLAGYSIGKWVDQDGDGRYDLLEVETRGFGGPRTLDSMGLPLHTDNQTIVKERIYSDKADRKRLDAPLDGDEDYRRARQARPRWPESTCVENNQHVLIGNEHYMLSFDGLLMPAKKDEAPPDLRYFNKLRK